MVDAGDKRSRCVEYFVIYKLPQQLNRGLSAIFFLRWHVDVIHKEDHASVGGSAQPRLSFELQFAFHEELRVSCPRLGTAKATTWSQCLPLLLRLREAEEGWNSINELLSSKMIL